MPHDIAIIDGKAAMMYVGTPPWHKLGTQFIQPPRTSREAIKSAGLDWKVIKKPVYAFDGQNFCKVEGYNATVRADDWGKPKCKPFGLVGDGYEVLQNEDAFSFFDPVVESGRVAYETAGALGDGERVWVLAKVQKEIVIKRIDKIEPYLLLANGHNGRTALHIRFTPVRVVCQNTLALALASDQQLLKTHHGRGMTHRIEMAQNLVKEILGHYQEITHHFERFANVSLSHERLAKYIGAIFPDPKRRQHQSERSHEEAFEKVRNFRAASERLFVEGRGNDQVEICDTLWAAYNGIAELVDHFTDYRDPWNRLESVCLGEGQRTKQRAFEVALEFSKN